MDSSERCSAVGCDSGATGSYLYAAHAAAVQFRVCDLHLAEVLGGGRPVVIESDDGHEPRLLIRHERSGQ